MVKDLLAGLRRWQMWASLAWEDICQKYRRNIIGPFWISLSNALTIAAMALIFSQVFNQKIDFFIPYLAAGMSIWTFMGSIITESTTVFLTAKPIMFSIKLPLTFHIYRMIYKNIILFLHIIIVYVLIALIFSVGVNGNTLFIIPSFLLLIANSIWFAILFGMLCARYRDLAQIIVMLFGICMYLTPIFWTADALGKFKNYLFLNPLYCQLTILRDAFLGLSPNIPAYLVCIVLAFIGFYFAKNYYSRHRNSLIFWL